MNFVKIQYFIGDVPYEAILAARLPFFPKERVNFVPRVRSYTNTNATSNDVRNPLY